MRGEPAYLVPTAFADYIAAHGGEEAYGIPHMPALPFATMTLQCYTTRCLMLPTGATVVQPAPLGEWLRGATALLPRADDDDRYHFERVVSQSGAYTDPAYSSADVPRSDGATTVWLRRDVLLQYVDDTVSVSNGGERYVRLPGIPYRWGTAP
jgi:hypothetical protein